MVVLAAAIVTKSGKAVVSRMFREMPRARIEGLLASFPKLTSTGHQHTTVETEHVRYVYQPLDELFIVLITNRQSNILQDIESLHLFARVTADVCRSTDERDITRNAFELIYAFDEIITEGHRENVNLAQVKSITEMESHEEKIQEIIARNKEQEAKEELKRRAKQLEMQRREAQKRGQTFQGGSGSSYTNSSFNSSIKPASTYSEPSVQPTESSRGSTPSLVGKGMKLGKKGKTADLYEELKTETGLEEGIDRIGLGSGSGQINSRVPTESIHLTQEEKITVVANRDGGLEQMEVKGDLTLRISDPNLARIKLRVRAVEDASLQFKTHPNVDKKLFSSENIIALKDSSRPFPVNQPLGVLRWRYITKDETAIPLSINCWPTPAGDGTCDVNIEYELEDEKLEFHDVIISIPLPAGANPTVGDVDGAYEINRQGRTIEWQLPIIDASNKTGTLEFSARSDDVNAFFPVSVVFVSERPFCDIEVLDVVQLDTDSPVAFSKEVLVVAEDYNVV